MHGNPPHLNIGGNRTLDALANRRHRGIGRAPPTPNAYTEGFTEEALKEILKQATG